jgi:hypothetical protein
LRGQLLETTINYQVNLAGNTSLKVFDLTGRTVRTLTNTSQKPGRYSINWNRKDDRGRVLAQGIYFVRLQSPNFEKTRKVIVQ